MTLQEKMSAKTEPGRGGEGAVDSQGAPKEVKVRILRNFSQCKQTFMIWKQDSTSDYGKRYAVSAIPNMQKLLNKEHTKQKEALKSLLSPTNYAF